MDSASRNLRHHHLCVSTVPTIMWIDYGRAWIVIYGILLVLARQLTLVFAGCAIEPDANGHVDIPSSWTSIGGSVFHRCHSLTTVSIPDNVTSIGGYAFYGCSSLETVSIPDSVTSIGGNAFSRVVVYTLL